MRDCDVTTGKQWIIMAVSFVVLTTYAEETEWNNRLEPADGITAAGQPNEANLRELSETGFAAVIDLRTDSENRGIDEQNLVEGLGMDYFALPIAGRGALNFDNAKRLDEILSQYEEPVLVHCGSGDRVGALFALRENMNGANEDDALAFGRSAGMTSLEATVKNRIAENQGEH